MDPASVVLRKCNKVKSGINAVTKPAIVVDLPAPLPPESVVTNSSRSKVRAKKPFQLIKVSERNLPRGAVLEEENAESAVGFSGIFSTCSSTVSSSKSSFSSSNSDIILPLARQIHLQFHRYFPPHFLLHSAPPVTIAD